MIYYLLVAIVDIGLYIGDHWKDLTFTAAASGIGIILGKRLGVRFAVNYFTRTFGFQKKSTLEQQVIWLIEQERKRGNVWSAPISKPFKPSIRRLLLKRGIWSRMVRSIVRYTKLLMRWRKKKMEKLKSRKFILAVVGAILIILNEGLDMGIDSETVLAFAGLLAVWISGESYVDGKRAEGVKTNEPTTTINTSEFEG